MAIINQQRMMQMKRLLYFIVFAVFTVFAIGCQEKVDMPDIKSDIVGQWKLLEINDKDSGDMTVYADFRSDASFTLYQKVWTVGYEKFEGTFELPGGGGVRFNYSDGNVSEYISLSFEDDAAKMILRKADGEIDTYGASSIPEQVISQAKPAVCARSGAVRPLL